MQKDNSDTNYNRNKENLRNVITNEFIAKDLIPKLNKMEE